MTDVQINVVSDQRMPPGAMAFVSPAEIVRHVFPDGSTRDDVRKPASLVVLLADGRVVGPIPIFGPDAILDQTKPKEIPSNADQTY
jgi:hypothetical protein